MSNVVVSKTRGAAAEDDARTGATTIASPARAARAAPRPGRTPLEGAAHLWYGSLESGNCARDRVAAARRGRREGEIGAERVGLDLARHQRSACRRAGREATAGAPPRPTAGPASDSRRFDRAAGRAPPGGRVPPGRSRSARTSGITAGASRPRSAGAPRRELRARASGWSGSPGAQPHRTTRPRRPRRRAADDSFFCSLP